MTFHDVRMRGFKRRADVDEIIAWVDARDVSRLVETVALHDARGRVLADALTSDVAVPGFARAAMDGWALQGADTFGATDSDPLPLRVIGTSLPGRPFARRAGESYPRSAPPSPRCRGPDGYNAVAGRRRPTAACSSRSRSPAPCCPSWASCG